MSAAALIVDNLQKEKTILLSFKDGKTIETDEEYNLLKKYASIGVVHFGFCFKKREGQASLTASGKNFFGLK